MVLALAVLHLGLLTARDLPDYFVRWPALPDVRYLYRADLHDAAPVVRTLPYGSDLALTSRTLHPADAVALALETPGQDLQVRVFSPERAWMFPAGRERVLVRHSAGQPGLSDFPFTGEYYLIEGALPAPGPLISVPSNRFGNGWECWSYHIEVTDSTLRLITHWYLDGTYQPPPQRVVEVLSGTPLPLKFFAHVLNPDGSVLTGEDRLDVDPATLRPGDTFLQLFILDLPAELAAGDFVLQIGIYDPVTGARVPLDGGDDALRLTSLELP